MSPFASLCDDLNHKAATNPAILFPLLLATMQPQLSPHAHAVLKCVRFKINP